MISHVTKWWVASLCALSSYGMPFPVQQLSVVLYFLLCSVFACVLAFILFLLYSWIHASYALWGAVNAWAYSLLSSTQSEPPVGTSIIAWHRAWSMKQQLETPTCPVSSRGIWNVAEINPQNAVYTSRLNLITGFGLKYCFAVEINQLSHLIMFALFFRTELISAAYLD